MRAKRTNAAAAFVPLVLITLGERRLFDRLLYRDRPSYEFVLAGVRGVLEGTPVSKSWQQRLLAPLAVSALDSVAGGRLPALELFGNLVLVAANLLLFALVRKKGGSLVDALFAVTAFGFAHLLLMYKLEYPWDGIDVLIFMTFGYWVSRGGAFLSLWPILAVGLFNHETVLYIPAFYLLWAFERTVRPSSPTSPSSSSASGVAGGASRKDALAACGSFLLLGAAILGLRERFYRGPPHDLPGQVFEPAMPIVGNHFHIVHNLRQFLLDDWRFGRMFIAIALASALATLVVLIAKRRHVAAALWSLGVIATIFCFGYINETRHYLLLVAFWFGYGYPVAAFRAGRRASIP